MENPKHYPELYNWVSEKTERERDILKEVWEELAATDHGTRYFRREKVSIRFSKETKVEAT